MPKTPKVSFVITAYNNRDIIDSCIKSVLSQSYKEFSIIVVDDCSTDGTQEHVRKLSKQFNQVKLISKLAQSGPSISRNLGIKATSSEYIAFMDSDVELSKDWLKALLDEMDKNPEIGIIGGKLLLNEGKKINSAGGALSRAGIGYDLGAGEPASHHNRQRDVMYLCSAAMLVRRDLLDKIGGFDETYFYGHEDTDLGWRANLAGYRVAYFPKATAYHKLGQTMKNMTDRVYFNSTKNRMRSILKNYEWQNAIFYAAINKLITLGLIIFSSKGRLARLKGLFWISYHLRDTLRERKKVQSTRKKTDRQLSALFSPIKNDR